MVLENICQKCERDDKDVAGFTRWMLLHRHQTRKSAAAYVQLILLHHIPGPEKKHAVRELHMVLCLLVNGKQVPQKYEVFAFP